MEEKKEKLKAFLLSPAASTESELTNRPEEDVPMLSNAEITRLLDQFAPQHKHTYDRLGQVPVLQYIISTYQTGLPNFASNPPLQQHTIRKSVSNSRANQKLVCPASGSKPIR